MATITVTTNADTGPGSLRAAIVTANNTITNPGPDIIEFAPSVGTINLASGALEINDNAGDLTIRGNAQNSVIIDGSAASTVISINRLGGGAPITLERLTIRNGSVGGNGGGIFNDSLSSTLTIIDSTVTGNTAGAGGGIHSQSGNINIINTTISGNVATGNGGGVYGAGGTISSATITNNTAGDSGAGNGGGIYSSASINVRNTIVAGNVDENGTGAAQQPDVSNTFMDLNNNIIGISNGSANFTNATTRVLNTLTTTNVPIGSLFGALASNGGPTQTHALVDGSVAIDSAGANATATGQRGVAISGLRRDVGAFEAIAPEINITGNSVAIADGDTTPDTADNTDFGIVALGSATGITKPFNIANLSSELSLFLAGSPVVSLTGADAGDFSVAVANTAAIAPNGSLPFTITFQPSSAGTKTAIVSITSNDADETIYTFTIQGGAPAAAVTPVASAVPPPPPLPAVAIAPPTVNPPSSIQGFSSAIARTPFTITNPNGVPLNLSGITLSENTNIFTIFPTNATVNPGETATFFAQVADDVLPGTYNTTVTIPSPVGDSVTFNLSATVSLPTAFQIAPIFGANLPSESPIWTNGDDVLIGANIDGDGRQWLNGGPGNDQIFGNLDRDVLTGGTGDDLIFGGKGDDWIRGAEGDDTLAGDFGDDTLIGGLGSDRFIIGAGRGSDEILDYTDGVDGFLLEPTVTFDQLTLAASGNSTQIKFGDELLVTVIGVGRSLLESSDFAALT
ncbi:MAG: choice-of-anchor D domain-containing protein [Cyanobacteria bacterium P01_C01_bin.89]